MEDVFNIDLANAHLTRQMDTVPMEILRTPITVIGVGAVGSWTLFSLAKMGFTDLTAIDPDTVNLENMNCQFYRLQDIGTPKVLALRNLIEEFTGLPINAIQGEYAGTLHKGIVVSSVDSMEVRNAIYQAHKDKAPLTYWLIDPRMAIETALLYTINPMNPEDQTDYETTLYVDEDAVQEPCTNKATAYTASLLSGMVVKAIKDVLTKSHRYPRTLNWSIAANQMRMWPKDPQYDFEKPVILQSVAAECLRDHLNTNDGVEDALRQIADTWGRRRIQRALELMPPNELMREGVRDPVFHRPSEPIGQVDEDGNIQFRQFPGTGSVGGATPMPEWRLTSTTTLPTMAPGELTYSMAITQTGDEGDDGGPAAA